MRTTLGCGVFALALVLGFAARANDRDDGPRGPMVFAKFDGIDGTSTQKGHEGEIEVLSFSESVRQATAASQSTGAAAGKPTFSPFVFTKRQDKASVSLLKKAISGQHIPQVTISFWSQASDGKPVKYFQITFKEVLISSVSEKSGDGRVADEIQLVFEAGRWEVFDPPDAAEFDLRTGKSNLGAPATRSSTR